MEFEAVTDPIEIRDIEKQSKVKNQWNVSWLSELISVKKMQGDETYECEVGEYIVKGRYAHSDHNQIRL